jgi:hypothetical protein
MHSDGAGRDRQLDRFVFHEAHQDAAEQLILPHHLVERCALLVAQLAELARLVHHLRVGGDRFRFGSLQVAADVDDQRRNVIEQAVAREDSLASTGNRSWSRENHRAASSACSAARRSAMASENPVVIKLTHLR